MIDAARLLVMGIDKTQNGTWRVRWNDHTGRRQTRVFPTRTLAEKFEHMACYLADQGQPLPEPKKLPHWRRVIEEPMYGSTAWHIESFDPRGFYVYLLWDDAETVIYVGQSTNILARLGAHMSNPDRRYRVARVTFIRCYDRGHMIEVEGKLIKYHQPELNRDGHVVVTDNPAPVDIPC